VQGKPAAVGAALKLSVSALPDDRMEVLTLGQQRFRVLEYVREKPTSRFGGMD